MVFKPVGDLSPVRLMGAMRKEAGGKGRRQKTEDRRQEAEEECRSPGVTEVAGGGAKKSENTLLSSLKCGL
jgi:hypothetical protein